jgi:hypothetical protein
MYSFHMLANPNDQVETDALGSLISSHATFAQFIFVGGETCLRQICTVHRFRGRKRKLLSDNRLVVFEWRYEGPIPTQSTSDTRVCAWSICTTIGLPVLEIKLPEGGRDRLEVRCEIGFGGREEGVWPRPVDGRFATAFTGRRSAEWRRRAPRSPASLSQPTGPDFGGWAVRGTRPPGDVRSRSVRLRLSTADSSIAVLTRACCVPGPSLIAVVHNDTCRRTKGTLSSSLSTSLQARAAGHRSCQQSLCACRRRGRVRERNTFIRRHRSSYTSLIGAVLARTHTHHWMINPVSADFDFYPLLCKSSAQCHSVSSSSP